MWNSLSCYVVSAEPVNCFKNRIDNFDNFLTMRSKFNTNKMSMLSKQSYIFNEQLHISKSPWITRQDVNLHTLCQTAVHSICVHTHIHTHIDSFSQKGSHLMFDKNSGKCGPILKILSPTDSYLCIHDKDFHLICNMLLHCLVSDFDLPAATILSYHDIVAARSAVGRSPSPVRWPGMRCLTNSETRRSVPTISGRR